MTALVWYRNDLRVHGHRALGAALASGQPVRALYLVTPGQWQQHGVAPARQWYVLESLRELGKTLAARGVVLDIIDCDDFSAVPTALLAYARKHAVTEVFSTREYPLNEWRRDKAVAAALAGAGVAISGFDDSVLVPPKTLKTGQGGWYTVFTPYRKRWQAWLADNPPACEALPDAARAVRFNGDAQIDGLLSQLELDDAVLSCWQPGEQAAREQLARFLGEGIDGYKGQRDLPAVDGTSGLSVALSAGTISVAECYLGALAQQAAGATESGVQTWISELAWRDFYRQIMANFPRLAWGEPFRLETRFVPWSRDPKLFDAWCRGETGIPLVDAAMRQLNSTGWMHNRLRMVTAMFLTKQLFIDWRWGEAYFMATLLDGDFAANNGGWQWSASTGTDAAPYFRVFNPVRQGQRFDPDGDFIRRWLPELAGLDSKQVHEPWKYADKVPGYPSPIVDLAGVRERVSAAFQGARELAQQEGM